jgi:uncharacterized Zn finger protein
MGCKNCIKCPECETRKIYASIYIKKDMELIKYVEQKFMYECKECGHIWEEKMTKYGEK